MNGIATERIYLYTRFERFWHWAQSALIGMLAFTGFEVHLGNGLMDFKKASEWHNWAGFSWLILYAFIIFWQLTTGDWKNYIPTTKKLMAVIRYYGYGIFFGEPHPAPKGKNNKNNPLQRIVYLSITVLLIPFQAGTGVLFYYYKSGLHGQAPFSLETLALFHTAGGFGFLIFVIVHVYMITTGHKPLAQVKAMITGWEEI